MLQICSARYCCLCCVELNKSPCLVELFMMCFFFRTQTSDTQSLSFKCDAQCTTAFVDSYSSCERKKLQVQNSIVLGGKMFGLWYRTGSSHGRDCCVVFMDKTLYSHSASCKPGVRVGTSELFGSPDRVLSVNLRWTSIPSRRNNNTPSYFIPQQPVQKLF